PPENPSFKHHWSNFDGAPRFALQEVRLSWQYHHRRAEIWRVYKGTAGIIRSATDEQGEVEVLNEGDQVRLQQGERHRLVGLQSRALIAEIWQHTDAENPSDEADIVRVSDDFGR
ncbi:MAG: hypothetical protein ACPGAA_04285, partial [Flavobacteriaceae bacterium]